MSGDPKKAKAEPNEVVDTPEPKQKTCFVIMPIADHPDYPAGHFMRVYDHIIKPACIQAGFVPDRADDAQHTHFIMLNILQRILDADLAVCDLSSKNPNVMYELGVRQAFDKPVTLIKDDKTSRIFDIGMLSDVEYASDLRIDNVQIAVDAIALRLQNTYDKKEEQVNSLIQLMKIHPAVPPKPTVVSPETNVLLEAIATLGRRITALEPRKEGLSWRSTQEAWESKKAVEALKRERDNLIAEIARTSAQVSMLRAKLDSTMGDPDGLEKDATQAANRHELLECESRLQIMQVRFAMLSAQISDS